ncbi:glycosyltransferase [Haladaptatus salinisoli]|uniref:glycosyltransferase n=1 Tax=Haladaptatus salinisoli TaxID=2884876 RepID=UPI001D0AF58C|nr:glycosyltransferase [Haladaptatus salinisoli]
MAKICFVNAQLPPHQNGGAGNYVLRVARSLLNRGHTVKVLTTKPYDGKSSLRPQSESMDEIPIERFYPMNISHRSGDNPFGLPGKVLWHIGDVVNPHSSKVAEEVFSEFDPDIIHTNNLMGISVKLSKIAQKYDRYHVHTLHDYGLICPKSTLLREWTAEDQFEVCESPPLPCQAYLGQKQNYIGSPDLVTGPSQHIIDIHQEHGFFEGVETDCIPLGVLDVKNSTTGVKTKRSFLFAGQQTHPKGLETIFQVARQLQSVTFHICGTGPLENKTKSVAESLPNLKYHGFVSKNRLEELREEVTAAIVPSLWMENSPLTIYESFARGLPVIGSKIGGIPELVSDDVRGILMEPGSTESLKSAVREIVEMENEKLANMQQSCLEWARRHTLEKHVDYLESDAYGEAMNEK